MNSKWSKEFKADALRLSSPIDQGSYLQELPVVHQLTQMKELFYKGHHLLSW